MIKHLNIRVRGRVQGVCFRAYAEETASSLGIRGWVRNERDGTVFIEAEGEDASLEIFVKWCRRGPPAAIVRDLGTTDGPLRDFPDFRIAFDA